MKTKQLLIALILGLVLIALAASASQAMPDRPSAEPATLAFKAPARLPGQDALGGAMNPAEPRSPPAGECGQLTPLWAPSHPAEPPTSQTPEGIAAQTFLPVVARNWDPVASDDPTEITVLTYNTHLFGGSKGCDDWWPALCYQDVQRLTVIVNEIAASGADIVALQEVWYGNPLWIDECWQEAVRRVLDQWYPYGYYANACTGSPLYIGSGLVLLSKWELVVEDGSFTKFPVYSHEDWPGDNDYWATKGVIAVTAKVGNPPQEIRIGISHAKTGPEDLISQMSKAYVRTGITSFELDGQPYIFALKSGDRDLAFVSQIEDYSYVDNGVQKYGAGNVILSRVDMSSDYEVVESFESKDGHPYLFLLHKRNDEAFIAKIDEDRGVTFPFKGDWGSNYDGTNITSFQLKGHPYIYALKNTDKEIITRINDDPATGWLHVYVGDRSAHYVAVESFELDGDPYLVGLKGSGDHANEALISRINYVTATNVVTGVDHFKWIPSWDSRYEGETITSFQLNGQPYIFGVRDGGGRARITRINPDWSIEHFDFDWRWNYGRWGTGRMNSVAVESFELNGEPYLFALRDCCSSDLNHCAEYRPGQLYIKRIYEDAEGNVQIEDINQLDDIRIIRDFTVRDDMPAIIMGDFNVNRSKYGIMNEIFAKAGAVDAWVAVHQLGLVVGNDGARNRLYLNDGSGDPWDSVTGSDITTDTHNTWSVALGDVRAGETINRCQNKLDQHFNGIPIRHIFPDGEGWDEEKHYSTIQTADIDGDGKAELLARANDGMVAWKFNDNKKQWELLVDSTLFAGWTEPENYSTIQTADIDGDGAAELLGRANDGMLAFEFNDVTDEWVPLGDAGPFPDDEGWDQEKFYRTIQTADIDGDGAAELLARGMWGMHAYEFNKNIAQFDKLFTPRDTDKGPFPDDEDWDLEKYYSTIQTADTDGDGKAELLARANDGMVAWKFNDNKKQWELYQKPDCNPDRIDYVYVRNVPPVVTAGSDQTTYDGKVSLTSTFNAQESRLGLVPTEARVIRDWKYDDGIIFDMDLSDHYPLVVKFKWQAPMTPTATVDWGDGTQDVVYPQDGTISGSHVYTVSGVYIVTVCVSDGLASGCDRLTITVENVSLTVDAGPDQSADEGSVVDLAAAFNDNDTLDTHTATIDWGDGSPPEAGLVSEAPGGTDGTVSGSHAYGDDGLFAVTVTVTNDHGASGSDSFDVTVNNVDPSVEIDRSDAVFVNGMRTFLAHAGESMDFAGRATDPGSDDLTLGWNWDDGSPVVTIEDLVHPPDPDPFPSPDVVPRDVTDTRTHTFGDACLYEIRFLVDDDDGGHGEDRATVIITANANKARSEGYWQHQYSGEGNIDFDQATLECYLAIVSHASTVFNEERDASTIEQAHDVLFLKQNQGSKREKLDRELLVVWLNFANGAIEYLELLDTDKDGIGDTPFADVVAAAEAVRLDPGATDKEIREQTNILHHVKQMSD
jgi:hypothetical protein